MTEPQERRSARESRPSDNPLWWLAGATVLAALPFVTSNAFHVALATDVLIAAILTLSLNLVVGKSGQFAVSHAAFYGIGAYAAGVISSRTGISGWLLLPVSLGLVALLALAVGIPVLRLRGYYLAVATLAFGKFCEVFVRQATPITGGPYGIQDIPRLQIIGYPLSGPSFYWLAAATLFVCIVILRNLSESPLGRAIVAVRDDPIAAEATGINVAHAKLVAFVLAASLAGAAGWLQAYYRGQLDPALLGVDLTFLWLFMVLVGGLGNYVGVFIGTALLIVAPEALGFASDRTILLVGIVMLAVALFSPKGIGGWIDRAASLASTRPLK